MCRIICISDTHGLHTTMKHNLSEFIDLNKTNILIHSGDCTNMGRQKEVEEFVYWFQNLKGFDHKIFIAGNHDFAFENVNRPHHKGDYDWFHNLMSPENLSQSDVTYLEDSEMTIDFPEFSRPIKFYGTPWQPEFYNWAFNLPRFSKELEHIWLKIPDDTDILITHGPPHGVRDFTNQYGTYVSVGSETLRHRIDEVNPLVNVYGHIHGAYGADYVKNTLFINASICDERYRPINKPIVVELKEYYGEIVAVYL